MAEVQLAGRGGHRRRRRRRSGDLMALHELAAAAVRVTLVAAEPAEPGPAPEGFVDLEAPLEPAQAAPVGG